MDLIKRKNIKKAIKIIWLTIVAVAAVLFAGALTIQFPQIQTAIGEKVISRLSEKLDGEISFEKIHFKPFTTLVLKNAVIIDKNPAQDAADPSKPQVDTFFKAGYIIAKLTLEGLVRQEGIHIDKVFISDARMNLVLEDRETPVFGDSTTENLSRIFKLKKKEHLSEPKDKELFHIRKVEILDMGFSMKNYGKKKIPHHGGISWDDLDIRDIRLNARELQFKNGIMTGEVDLLTFCEKSGYRCLDISGEARVGRGKTIVENLNLKDSWSDLKLPLFMMSYVNVRAFKDFISEVKLDGKIAESSLDFRTLSYFAPQLKGNAIKATVSGTMSGYVDDFSVNDIRILTDDGGFKATVDGRMTGLPEISRTRIDAKVRKASMTAEGLGRFISEWMRDGELDLRQYALGTTFSVDATAKGLLNSLDVKADIRSQSGAAVADLALDNLIESSSPLGISGYLRTDDLDIGHIAGIPLLGPASIRSGFNAKLGEVMEVNLDSLRIERLQVKGYDYSDIEAKGILGKNILNGTVVSKDPNLNFIFQGGYAKSEKSSNTVYKFAASIGHADLHAINLDPRAKSEIQLRTNANFTRTGKGDILGRIDVGEIMLESDEGRQDIGNIVLTSHSADNRYRIRLDSGFADATFTGTASIVDFIKDLSNVTLKKEMPALYEDPEYSLSGNTYSLDFKCHDVQGILAFALPGLYIENGTSLHAELDSKGIMNAGLSSKRIAFKKQYLKGISASFDNKDNNFSGELACDEISVATMKLNENSIQIHADDNHVGIGYSFDNHSDYETRGQFIVHGNLSRNDEGPVFGIDIRPSALYYNAKEWNIHPSEIIIAGGNVDINKFSATSGEQSVGIDGKASKEDTDTLTLNLERFDISVANALLPAHFGIKGAATGIVQLTSPLKEKGLLVDMICDSTRIADVPLGILTLGTTWNEEEECFDMVARNDLEGKSSLNLFGSLTPKTKYLNATASLDRVNLGYAQPFIKDIFSNLGGYASGEIMAYGPIDRLTISSMGARLEDAELTVAYTGVPYTANGPFHINETGVFFDNIRIRDRYNGTGVVSGSINYDHFKDFDFNTHIKADRIEAVNLDEKSGDVFYGNLSGTGNVQITGPVNSLTMTVDAVTSKAGQLHIPMSSSLTSGNSTNLLKFTELETEEYIDPYEIFVKKATGKEKSSSDFFLKLRVNASPDVEAFVEIDKSTGNVLSGRGNGTIDLEVGNDIFNINGDYTLTDGNYKFVAMGLVSRDFKIQEGSSIRFNGDIMESTLDIDAIYKTKASLSTLISDTTSVANRRNVECGIGITDKLSNPRLSFSIEIPDLDPTIKSRVESALSTEDKVQKQFLSLIISNNFLPDEQSGIVNNSSVLYSNVSEMMANQLNNIFQKLDIPLDLGLKYQPNERGNDIFDVAVSTQLFNNRVVVNGNIGNKQYNSGSSQNDVVGDLDIEIKLNRSGSYRLKIFSRSADQYTNYLDNSQRNGVGLMYQTEFNSFRQFFRNMFSSKAKRQEAKRLEEQAMLEGGKVRLEIEAPEEKNQDGRNE